MSDSLALPTGRLPWWYPTRSKLVILSLALVLIVGVSWGVWRATHCASGVRRVGAECVGVTDGSFVFSPDLAEVLGRIRDENRWVEQQRGPSISIAYLVSVPREAGELSDGPRHELQGAYLAQRRVNRTSELGDLPLIRLLVANAGEGNEQWQPVIAQLRDRVGSDRLLAVAGLGQSLETTRQAIAALTEPENPDAEGIPAIAARLASEDISGGSGFVRMASTASDQASVAAAYLKLSPEISTALLVQDVNVEDRFVKALGDAFTLAFPDSTHTLLGPVEEYDGSLDGLANRFAQMMEDICQQRPDVVYFAGRGRDLADFIEALPGRPCRDFPVNLVTGSAGATTAIVLADGEDALKDGLESGVTLRYTAHAHPDAWAAMPESFSPDPIEYFQQGCANQDCFTQLFPSDSLDDSGAIMGHDAVVAAVRAIRSAAGQRDLSADPITLGEVVQSLKGLHGASAVPGASGWISLDGSGNPINKAIPILELHPDGTVAFVALSAAGGAPFVPPSSSVLGTQS
ncbi:MAG: ABC transporter substrate-binding protein [Egibacteraceae bacterium]